MQIVTCNVRNADQYGRNVSVCKLGDEDLNAWLVENGLAVAYRWVHGWPGCWVHQHLVQQHACVYVVCFCLYTVLYMVGACSPTHCVRVHHAHSQLLITCLNVPCSYLHVPACTIAHTWNECILEILP